jgi:hypothetical protein
MSMEAENGSFQGKGKDDTHTKKNLPQFARHCHAYRISCSAPSLAERQLSKAVASTGAALQRLS